MAENKELCVSCPYEAIIEELRRDSERNSEQHREFYDKFNSQETAIAISTERYNNLLQVISEVKASIDKINASIQEINAKPGRKWDSAVATVISCLVAGVVGFMLSKVGL